MSNIYVEDHIRFIEFTRPADLTAYAANDVIRPTTSDTGTTPLVGMDFGVGPSDLWIVHAKLESDVTTFLPAIRCHLFAAPAPPTAIVGDNTAFVRNWTNRKYRIGSFDFPALQLERSGDTAVVAVRNDIRDKMRFYANDQKMNTRVLYPVLEALAAATPGSEQSFRLTIQLANQNA